VLLLLGGLAVLGGIMRQRGLVGALRGLGLGRLALHLAAVLDRAGGVGGRLLDLLVPLFVSRHALFLSMAVGRQSLKPPTRGLPPVADFEPIGVERGTTCRAIWSS